MKDHHTSTEVDAGRFERSQAEDDDVWMDYEPEEPDTHYRCENCGQASFTVGRGRPCPWCGSPTR